MNMKSRIRNKFVRIISIIIGALVLGLGMGQVASASDTDGGSAMNGHRIFNAEVILVSEEDPMKTLSLGSAKAILLKERATGLTYKEFFETAIKQESSIDFYEVTNAIFLYMNGALNAQQVADVMKKSPLYDDITAQGVEELSQPFKDQFTGFSVNMSKTKEADTKTVVPSHIEDGDTYSLPDFYVYMVRNNVTMHINYLMSDGSKAFEPKAISGYAGQDAVSITSPVKEGYTIDKPTVQTAFTEAGNFTVNVHYQKIGTPTGTTTRVNAISLTADASATVTTADIVNAATFHAKATDSQGRELPVSVDLSKVNLKKPGTYSVSLSAANGQTKVVSLIVKAASTPADKVAVKQEAIYGLKTLYLYRQPTFTKAQRLVKYSRKSRVDRPMFIVTGYGRSKAGRLRYQVRDANQRSKTFGKTGYITANSKYVGLAYYQKVAQKIKIINTHGINSYQQLNLTGQQKHFKREQTLKVVGLKKYHLTTRFVLSDGQVVTANKKLVQVIK